LPPNPALAESFKQRLPSSLAIVEERLRDGRPLLMGDQPSIVDCTLAAALQFGRVAKFEIDSAYQNIARWDQAFRERVSAKQILLL
jgi:glutathione S-transferase